MRKPLALISMLVLSLILIISCSKNDTGGGDTPIDCSNTPKTFATDVNPIIQTFCNQTACHDAGSSNGVGPLTNYTQIRNNSAAIRSAIAAGTMPQNTTLSTAQKNTIICWIDNGAQNN